MAAAVQAQARIDRGRASARGPASGGSRSRGSPGDRRPSRVPRAPSRCARRPRSPRQQQPSGAAWRKRRSCARSWGAGARRWARRARSAHVLRTCRPRRLAARACGGLGWRSSRRSPEARRTRGRRERVTHVVGPSRGVEEDRVAARRPLRTTFRWTTLRGPPSMNHPEWTTRRDRFPRRRLGLLAKCLGGKPRLKQFTKTALDQQCFWLSLSSPILLPTPHSQFARPSTNRFL